jgi:hypothetical protein
MNTLQTCVIELVFKCCLLTIFLGFTVTVNISQNTVVYLVLNFRYGVSLNFCEIFLVALTSTEIFVSLCPKDLIRVIIVCNNI